MPDNLEIFTRLFARCTSQTYGRQSSLLAARIQAVIRGKLARRRYYSKKKIKAEVTRYSALNTGSNPITTYVIAVHRDDAVWEVEHRFSDWCELHRKLSEHLKQRPSLPPRWMIGKRDAAYRTSALNRYLCQVIDQCNESSLGRIVLLNFLSRSHVYWQYIDHLKDWRDKAMPHKTIAWTRPSSKRLWSAPRVSRPDAGDSPCKQTRRLVKRRSFGEDLKAKVAQLNMSSLSTLPPVEHVATEEPRKGFVEEHIL